MLESLLVRNLVLVESAQLQLSAGLTAITGETGAGKSLMMSSLSLAVGNRALTDDVGPFGDQTSVQASFKIEKDSQAIAFDIHRVVRNSGNHSARLNGQNCTLSEIKDQLSGHVEILQQDDVRLLRDPGNHIVLVDAWVENRDLYKRVEEVWAHFQTAKAALQAHRQAERDRELRIEILQRKLDEVQGLIVEPEEYSELLERAKWLANYTQLREAIGRSLHLLSEQEDSAADALSQSSALLSQAAGDIKSIASLAEQIEDASALVEESIRSLQSLYKDDEEDGSAELEQLEEQIALIQKFCRQEHIEVHEAAATYQALQTELTTLHNFDEEADKLELAVQKAESDYTEIAGELTKARKSAIERIKGRCAPHFIALGLPDNALDAAFEPAAPSALGLDSVRILFRGNADQDLRNIEKTASGGEMSRVQLALAVAQADIGAPRVYVLDEIDAGVGGETAHKIAELLMQLAQRHQVFSITHLAQVAAAAGQHYVVQKDTMHGRTQTVVHEVRGPERLQELSRMLGWTDSAEASSLAQALLDKYS